jgi:hypothetical protein
VEIDTQKWLVDFIILQTQCRTTSQLPNILVVNAPPCPKTMRELVAVELTEQEFIDHRAMLRKDSGYLPEYSLSDNDIVQFSFERQ